MLTPLKVWVALLIFVKAPAKLPCAKSASAESIVPTKPPGPKTLRVDPAVNELGVRSYKSNKLSPKVSSVT